MSYVVLSMLRKSLKDMTDYDVLSVNPGEAIKNVTLPCMFILGDSDELVKFSRFKEMFDNCSSEKKIFRIEEDCGHPDPRSDECITKILEFMGVTIDREPEEDEEEEEKPSKNYFHRSMSMRDKFNLEMTVKYKSLSLRTIYDCPGVENVDDWNIFDNQEDKPRGSTTKNRLLNFRVDKKLISQKRKVPVPNVKNLF